MLQPVFHDKSVDLVFANDLDILVNHLAPAPAHKHSRGQIACDIADSLQATFLEMGGDTLATMSEAEVLALVASRSSDPIRRYKISRPWTSTVPFVAVRDDRQDFRVPRGNVVTLDATSDRSLLLSLMDAQIVRVLEGGQLLRHQ